MGSLDPHIGFTGVVSLRQSTFAALIEDLCANYARMGFRRIVFLNGHWDNTHPIAYACANAAEKMPLRRDAFPITYWESMNAAETAEFFVLHANRSETSAVLAINPNLVDMDVANVELPPFPDYAAPVAAHTAFLSESRVDQMGDQVGYVGRRPRRIGRVRSAISRRGLCLGHSLAQRHRTRVCGNASPVGGRSMFTATKDLMLPATVTGSWPRPRWYDGGLWGRPLDTALLDVRFREQFLDAHATVIADQERAGLDILTNGDYHLDEDFAGRSWHHYPLQRWNGLEHEELQYERSRDRLLAFPPAR